MSSPDRSDDSDQGIGHENTIYQRRFTSSEEATRSATWQVLCERFFQPRLPNDATVVDLGAGDGNFIRHIRCKTPIAVDLSEHCQALAANGIEVHCVAATEFAERLSGPADAVFMSNFLEHLPTKSLVLSVLEECRRALVPNGRVLILQPNIRYVGAAYWDYIDHHIALTEHSLLEALDITGFETMELIPRFLPYTAKSAVGRAASGKWTKHLVGLYLQMPWLWRFLGGQTFVMARKIG